MKNKRVIKAKSIEYKDGYFDIEVEHDSGFHSLMDMFFSNDNDDPGLMLIAKTGNVFRFAKSDRTATELKGSEFANIGISVMIDRN